MKTYYGQYMGGTIRYTVNYHDGVKKHVDGSPFYDVRIFKSQAKRDNFMRELRRNGYQEATCSQD